MDKEDYITDTDSLQDEDAAQPDHADSNISPAFQAAFDELTPRSRVTIAEEANSLPMPDADTAARAVDLVIATLFDVFRDTRMEPAAPKLTTGIILAFVNAADRSRGSGTVQPTGCEIFTRITTAAKWRPLNSRTRPPFASHWRRSITSPAPCVTAPLPHGKPKPDAPLSPLNAPASFMRKTPPA